MEYIKNIYKNDEVLLMYRCGSYAFGTVVESSDEDFIVVLKNFKGMSHTSNGKKEYFIFGVDAWKKKMEFSDEYDENLEIFNDEILVLDKTLIYMSDEIKGTVDDYVKAFESKIDIWIKKIISYYEFYFALGGLTKNMYHLLRFKYILEQYELTGRISNVLSDAIKKKIIDYKLSTDREPFRKDVVNALKYLKEQ